MDTNPPGFAEKDSDQNHWGSASSDGFWAPFVGCLHRYRVTIRYKHPICGKSFFPTHSFPITEKDFSSPVPSATPARDPNFKDKLKRLPAKPFRKNPRNTSRQGGRSSKKKIIILF